MLSDPSLSLLTNGFVDLDLFTMCGDFGLAGEPFLEMGAGEGEGIGWDVREEGKEGEESSNAGTKVLLNLFTTYITFSTGLVLAISAGSFLIE